MFKQRLDKNGMLDNPYWYSSEYNFRGSDLQLPNCTCYCLGRSSEIANTNVKKIMFPNVIPNAKDWFTTCTWAKGSKAKQGAIAVWGGTYGHVAIVEECNGNQIKVSQSNYEAKKDYNSKNYFQVKTYNVEVGKKTSGVGLVFLGFIYNPYVKEEEDMELIKITKEKDYDYKWSVDGNKYGDTYDITSMNGFGDTELVKNGWEEVLAVNGGLFYTYENKHFACGLEKSRGVNNQELEMSCVTDYNNTGAIACVEDELWFAKQSWIIKNKLEQCYGALTGMIIVLGGKAVKYIDGFTSQFNQVSGRTIVGEDKEGNILSYSFSGETGKSGLTGTQAQTKCLELGFVNAIMLDGGGSVWRRLNGKVDISTSRKVKNSLLLYRKKKENTPIEEKPIENTDWEAKYNELQVKLEEANKKIAELETTLQVKENALNEAQEKLNKIKDIL